MPYINKKDRERLTNWAQELGDEEVPTTPGELNYLITFLCLDYLKGPSYADHQEIVGVLECVKLEFYRRAMAELEDKKIEENGDVY